MRLVPSCGAPSPPPLRHRVPPCPAVLPPRQAKNLPVKWDATLGFFVPGLKQVTCSKVDTMAEVGAGRRSTAKWTGRGRNNRVSSDSSEVSMIT